MNYDAIGAAVARDVFALGDDLAPPDKAQRLEYKGGKWPEAETVLGGLCEQALAGHIADSLRRHMAETREDNDV